MAWPTGNEVRARLAAAARRTLDEHQPVDGRCPLCRVADCGPGRAAAAYLEQVADQPADPGPGPAVAILTHAAVPAAGVDMRRATWRDADRATQTGRTDHTPDLSGQSRPGDRRH